VVLKSSQVPSILVELGFVSSDRDRNALKKASHRAALAKALADGIDRYFEEFAPSKRTFQGR
jgi:N-acetylmuramoyl-L-alanine amidase